MKIAVTNCGQERKQHVYEGWLKSFSPSAELIVISPSDPPGDVSLFDGLVLTGGEDVDPEFSKASPVEKIGKRDPLRDRFEFQVLDNALRHALPILGICRGLQVMNVFFGGTLAADLQYEGYRSHETGHGEPENRHTVTVYEGSMLRSIVGTSEGVVNSYHHQAAKEIAHDLTVSSFADDGVVESLEWKEQGRKPFLLAVQWHPERMKDTQNPFTQKIGEAFFAASLRMSLNQSLPHTQ